MYPLSIIILLIIDNKFIVAFNNECDNLNHLCSDSMTCRDCIRKNHCCVWCYDQDFVGKRCFAKGTLQDQKCNSNGTENNVATSVTITKQNSFADVKEDVNGAVQLSPQEFNIFLRHEEPINLTITYRPAKNFPLDLYYLMDLTWSMKPDLETLKTLGSSLTTHLEKLTKNYHIAFGSYIDKPEVPYYLTDPTNRDNPCNIDGGTCEKGYVFKHRINFTNYVKMFIEKVTKSDVSANLDDLEGGLDALMQILFCGKKLGWRTNSRKLVLVATEAGMHLAGDGILGGYTKRNEKGKCLVDNDGNYVLSQYYDYPSLEEVDKQLKDKKTNLIVAAKSHMYYYYKRMADVLKEAIYVGELQINSTNVLNLVDEGYYSFIRKVNLFTTEIDGLEVDFFADCDGNGIWKKKQTCTNAEEGKEINFKVQLMLTKYQNKESDVLYIEESNIQEKIKINLNYVGSTCTCLYLEQKGQKTCDHGEFNCGDCLCEEGWTGDTCSEQCINNQNMCRYVDNNNITSLTCSGRGNCICSKCNCQSKRYQGEFCEWECPYDKSTQQVCAENCKIPGYDGNDSICNGKGTCNCNTCECDKGSSGHYCENCDGCQGLCNRFNSQVIEHVINRNQQIKPVRVEIVEDLPEEKRSCVHRYEQDGKKCDIFYTYNTIWKDNSVLVKATEPICNAPLAAGTLVGLIIGAFLLLAFIIIVVWKGRNWIRDKREYQEFLRAREQSKHSEENPIYKNPVVTYNNPMEKATVQT
ncbi:integrin beta-nu-like isoform X2 [Zophobas morio]|uniref:integrin beta-nu-like isoform X2 n=1 Tax=Zophobas morio TaxID=2755281 RepID=UPI0030837194